MVQNIRAAFAEATVEATVHRQWSRLFIQSEDPRALAILQCIFGISSLSPVDIECPATVADIVREGEAAFKDKVAGRSFAVRARRVGLHDYTSLDVARALGAALGRHAAKVDLGRPEVEVHADIRDGVAYLYSDVLRGPGGLPLGVSGKVLCLISGGFDSAVAAWQMQKRGVDMDYVFFNLAGAAYERSVLSLAKFLVDQWGHGTRPRLHVVDFTPVADEIRRTVKPSHAQVILKRMFYRAACRLATELGVDALLTGECVGQVSSQTLRNLCTIETVADRMILRPLVGCDKEEITTLARRIGSFAISAGIQEYCQLVPDKPVTACRPDTATREEQDFNWAVIDAAVEGRRMIAMRELKAADLVTPYLYTEQVPAGAVVIDCRPEEAYAAWHYPGAINTELYELLADFSRFDKKGTYVLYCPVGLQSAVAAEKMQKAGFTAYSFKGGVKALHEHQERESLRAREATGEPVSPSP